MDFYCSSVGFSSILSAFEIGGKSAPWIDTESSETIKTIWKRSEVASVHIETAMIANTQEDAPLSPAQETSVIWRRFLPGKTDIRPNTETGLETNVMNTAIISACGRMLTISEGVDKRPIRKKIRISQRLLMPSK